MRFGKSNVDDYVVLKFSASSSFNRRLGADEDEIASPPEIYGMIEDAEELEVVDGRELRIAP
ncbi:hypothetical protein OG705_30190 [Streptomyces sp. NBC_00838]|uniref:hypothetical protein n=1 Tax=Streptomyces sp. NBC_00838 TaxID=2903680 RepID=UPI0038677973|nr:hypothetical protein OG705_30190 [Streptomyces sp. NBC_00838]